MNFSIQIDYGHEWLGTVTTKYAHDSTSIMQFLLEQLEDYDEGLYLVTESEKGHLTQRWLFRIDNGVIHQYGLHKDFDCELSEVIPMGLISLPTVRHRS